MTQQNNEIQVLGWTCTIEVGDKTWANKEHAPTKSTGMLWWRHDKVTVHLPPELGGDKLLDGHIQVKEQKQPGRDGRLQTVTTAHLGDRGIATGEFGLLSFVKWLLLQNGVEPRQMVKK